MNNIITKNPPVICLNPGSGAGMLALSEVGCVPLAHYESHPVLELLYKKHFPNSKRISDLSAIHRNQFHTGGIVVGQNPWNNVSVKNRNRDPGVAINEGMDSIQATDTNSPDMWIFPLLPSSLDAVDPTAQIREVIPPVELGSTKVCYMSWQMYRVAKMNYPIVFCLEATGQEAGMAHHGKMLFVVAAKRLEHLSFDINIFRQFQSNYGIVKFKGKLPPKPRDDAGWAELLDHNLTYDQARRILPAVMPGDFIQRYWGIIIAACSRTASPPLWRLALSKLPDVYLHIDKALNDKVALRLGAGIDVGIDVTDPNAVLPRITSRNTVLIQGIVYQMPAQWFTQYEAGRSKGDKWLSPNTGDTQGWQHNPYEHRKGYLEGKFKSAKEFPQLREYATVHCWKFGNLEKRYLELSKRFNLPPLPTGEPNRQLSAFFVAWLCSYPWNWFDEDLGEPHYAKGSKSRYDREMTSARSRKTPTLSPIMQLVEDWATP